MSYNNNKPRYQNNTPKPDVSNMVLPLTAKQIADLVYLMERMTVQQRRDLLSHGHQMISQPQSQSQQQSNFQASNPPNRGRFSNNPNYHNSNNNSNDESDQQQPSYVGKKPSKYQPKSQQRTHPNGNYNKNFKGNKNYKNNQSNDHSNDQSNDQSNEGQDDQEYEYEQEPEQETPVKGSDWAEATDKDIDDIPEMPKQKSTFKKQQTQDKGETQVKFKRREAPQPKEVVVQEDPKENLSI